MPALTPTLTAQEKLERGLPLSGDDIKTLISSTGENWIKKLFLECQAIRAIEAAEFIHYVEISMHEERMERAAARSEAIQQQITNVRQQIINDNKPAGSAHMDASKPATLPLAIVDMTLKVERASLLNVDQTKLTAPQLEAYQSHVVANLRNQVAANLGTVEKTPDGREQRVVELNDPAGAPVKLVVPQLSARPVTPLEKILSYNPDLAQQLKTDADMRSAFATAHVLNQLSYLSAINQMNDIETANNYELNVSNRVKMSVLMRNVQSPVFQEKENIQLQEALFTNATLQMNAFNTRHYRTERSPSLTTPPLGTFSNSRPKPGMGGARKVEDDQYQSPTPLNTKFTNRPR